MTGLLDQIRATLADDHVSDSDLLERFVAGRDESAFASLMRRHGAMVYGVCRRLLNSPQDAEDAFQATFVVLARKAETVRRREVLASWLYGVAYRAALKARALNLRRSKETQVALMLADLPSAARDNGLPWDDLHGLLDAEVERLPDNLRAPVVLCDLEGKSRKEAAVQLQIPEGTLSSRLDTARKTLAKRLTRRGVALSAGALTLVMPNPAAAAVPAALMSSTLQAAVGSTGGAIADGVVSTTVITLTEGVLQAMFFSKIKTAAAIVLAVALSLGGLAVVDDQFLAAQPAPKAGDKKDTPKQPDAKKDEKREARKAPATFADNFPTTAEKLKKHKDEIVKIREAMLKELADEQQTLDEAIKKNDAALKGGDKAAFKARAELISKKHSLQDARHDVERHVRFSQKKPAPTFTDERRFGLHVGGLDSRTSAQLGLEKNVGLAIDRIDADSPAAKAGIKVNDVLIKFAGKAVTGDRREFSKLATGVAPSTQVEVVVMRAGKQETITGLTAPAATTTPKK